MTEETEFDKALLAFLKKYMKDNIAKDNKALHDQQMVIAVGLIQAAAANYWEGFKLALQADMSQENIPQDSVLVQRLAQRNALHHFSSLASKSMQDAASGDVLERAFHAFFQSIFAIAASADKDKDKPKTH